MYKLGGGTIPPRLIGNEEDLSFFHGKIFISIQHWTPLYVLIMERTIPAVPNYTQDSHISSFVPKMAEGEKIVGHKLVSSLRARLAPVNRDHRVESPHYFPYVEWGVEGMRPQEFDAYFGEYVENNSNDTETEVY